MKSLIKNSVDLPDIFQQLNNLGTELASIDVALNNQAGSQETPAINIQGAKFSYFGRSKENVVTLIFLHDKEKISHYYKLFHLDECGWSGR